MFRNITETTHNSGSSEPPPPLTNDYTSKLLVTRRSWQAGSTWARLPTVREARKLDRSFSENVASPVAWVGDLVDGGLPLYVSADERDEHPSAQVPKEVADTVTRSDDPSLDPAEREVLLEFLRVHGFRPYQLVMFLLSVLTYISDVGSDAYLVYSYLKQGDYIWSGLTMALMIIPALIMTSFSLVWYVLDRKVRVDPPRTCRAWALRLLFHALQLAPLVRLADAVYYGIASRRADVSLAMAVHYTQLMLYEDADSAMLRMIECFMEAAPQLLLQLYIIFTQEKHKQTFQIIAQAVSCSTSWLSLAWSLTHYQSALRSSRVEKANLRWSGSVLYFGWKACILASRLLSLAMFAAVVHSLWFGLSVGVHWLLSVCWLIVRGTTFCSPTPHTLTECLFDAVLGAVYCFDVINVREGHSRLAYLSWYTLIAVENGLMTVAWSRLSVRFSGSLAERTHSWLVRPRSLSSWIHSLPTWVLPSCVGLSFLLGIGMMIVYYLCAHPSGRIRVCIPFSELVDVPELKSFTSTEVTRDPNKHSARIDEDRKDFPQGTDLLEPCDT